MGHLRTFGCTAYVHVTEEKTGPRAIKGVFVGYPMGTKGYRVWIEDEGRCITSRNVVFNEEELYKYTIAKEKQSTEVTKETDKLAKKKVSFSDDLIRGPSPSVESKYTSDQGGEESSLSSSNSSSDQEQDHEVDSESDHEGESESGDTETLNTYVLARDRE